MEQQRQETQTARVGPLKIITAAQHSTEHTPPETMRVSCSNTIASLFPPPVPLPCPVWSALSPDMKSVSGDAAVANALTNWQKTMLNRLAFSAVLSFTTAGCTPISRLSSGTTSHTT